MSKIVFLKEPNTVYDGAFSQIGKNQLCLTFTDTIPSTETLTSGFNLVNEHNGRPQTKRTDYTYIYRTYADNPNMVELCNDNTPYVEPEITVQFNTGFGGTLEGETKQTAKNYEDLVIPTPVADENYVFVGWNPDIPSSGKIEKNVTFTAQFVYVETLDEIRNAKIAEFNTICNQIIEAGQDITLSNGETIHFDYTDHNQKNLENAANIALMSKEKVPYYDSNNNCYIFEAIDAITIYASCQGYITYLLTLDHHLEKMIKTTEDKDIIKSLVFAEESLDENIKAEFDIIMAQAQIVAEKYMANAIASLGTE